MAPAANPIRVAILGCGNIGTALLEGILGKKSPVADGIFRLGACTRSSQSLDRLRQRLGANASKAELGHGHDAAKMAEQANLVLLGCRAEGLSTMLKTVKPGQGFAKKTVVSLMAGLSFQGLRQKLVDSGAPEDTPVIRVIPTFGARAANSASLMAVDPSAKDSHVELVEKFFQPVGSLLQVDESLLNKGVPVGAACHALAVTAVDTITDTGVAEGIPRVTTFALAAQNLASASKLMADGMSVEELKAALSTPSGITLNSVLQLERGGVRVGVADATRAAIKHAESM